MSEELTRPADPQTGQATAAPGDAGAGQSGITDKQPTQPEQAASTQAEALELVSAEFDSLPPEDQARLRPHYEKIRRELQGGFTRKAQQLAQMRQQMSQKVQAYDEFMANPIENIMKMGRQYGLNLTPAQAQQVANQQQQSAVINPDWTPGTWEEVFAKSGEFMTPKMQELLQQQLTPYQEKMAALERELSEVRASRVKKQLDQIDPNWQMYEDEMRQVLEIHPSLANDIPKLYRLAVPEEQLMTKATQAALKKYEQKAQAAKIESSGQTRSSTPEKPKITTFEEAFQNAKRELGRK